MYTRYADCAVCCSARHTTDSAEGGFPRLRPRWRTSAHSWLERWVSRLCTQTIRCLALLTQRGIANQLPRVEPRFLTLVVHPSSIHVNKLLKFTLSDISHCIAVSHTW